MRRLLSFLFPNPNSTETGIRAINRRRAELEFISDEALRTVFRQSDSLIETIAATAVVAQRLLKIEMFDVQIQGAMALADGKIVEMQTGEGKTLAAVPAIAWCAKVGKGIHVMTANDYLARRDAEWMGGIYRFAGLSVGCIQQDMTSEQRRSAYACDVTYGTANEIGFDYLRDQLALYPKDQVQREFFAALIDEVDSILIDEARAPLVIAGDHEGALSLAYRVDAVTRHFRRLVHYTADESGRSVGLTDTGITAIEDVFHCGNLFEVENLSLHTAVQDSLHAHALLRRDVDYLVKNGAIESVDEFKGRIIQDRRWPGGLHTAIEAKEGVAPKKRGKVLGSLTLQNLIALYPMVCGMTGTAATQAGEFRKIYELEVQIVPTNRPMIRVDHPDIVFRTRRQKEQALVEEIRRVYETGQPILVGTASVEESERLSTQLAGIPHRVLNARNDEAEAAIVRGAGQLGAITISTNMAGRGTDIQLGAGVAELGGLYVIGTNRHESRRIDNQLRGRAGRQGDPGCSRFFVSYEDELLVKYGINDSTNSDPADIQRRIEGQLLDLRQFLNKYERVAEGQRMAIQQRRRGILDGSTPCASERERLAALITIDKLWSEYLSALAALRANVHWVSVSGGGRDPIQYFFKFGGFDPFGEYLHEIHALFKKLVAAIAVETPKRLASLELTGIDPTRRGSTWTYVTTDQPFGTWISRALRDFLQRARLRNA